MHHAAESGRLDLAFSRVLRLHRYMDILFFPFFLRLRRAIAFDECIPQNDGR